jgi:hypothetical protein
VQSCGGGLRRPSQDCCRFGCFKGGEVAVADADLGGHEFVEEIAKKRLKNCKLLLALRTYTISLINAPGDSVLLIGANMQTGRFRVSQLEI